MIYADANVILRYILDDHAEYSPMARKIIGENIVEIPVEVLCEVVFVLKRVYNIDRKEIADTLIDFIENTNCVLTHKKSILRGIEYFGEKNLDFVDCLLAAYHEVEHIAIHTFDEKLKKLLELIAETKK